MEERKLTNQHPKPELLDEYDFSKGVRGKYAKRAMRDQDNRQTGRRRRRSE
jgi:hypothetical protein